MVERSRRDDALSTCRAFLRMYFLHRDVPAAARFFTEDATWFGDGQITRVAGRAEVIRLLERGAGINAIHCHLTGDELREDALADGASLVEGDVLMRDDEAGLDRRFRLSATLVRRDCAFAIRSVHFHLLNYTGHFNVLFDHTPWGVAVLEYQKGKIGLIYFNEVTSSMMGYGRDELRAVVEREPYGLVMQEDIPILRERAAQMITQRVPIEVRFRAHANGGLIWVHMLAQIYEWMSGKDLIMVSVIDVTREVTAKNQLSAMIANIPGGVVSFEVGTHGIRQMFLSDWFRKMLGYDLHVVDGADVADAIHLTHPDDRPHLLKIYNAVLAGADSVDVTFRVRKSSGQYIWVNLRATLYQAAGDQRLLYGIYIDVDDKARAIADLDAAKTELERIITSLPAGVAVFEYEDEVMKPRYFSDRLCEIFGMTRQQCKDTISPERPFGMFSEMPLSSPLDGQPYGSVARPDSYEWRARKGDGTPFWIRATGVFDRQSDLPRFYVIMQDITAEVTLRQAERWQAERYRILSESSDATIFDYDPVRDEMTYSAHALGKDVPDLVMPSFRARIIGGIFLHPEDRATGRKALATALRGPTQGTIEVRAQVTQSGYRWYRVRYVSLADADGSIYRVIGRADDIQRDRYLADMAREKARREALYRRATTADAELALAFDLTTGRQIASDVEIRPAWLPEGLLFGEVLAFLRERALYTADIDVLNESDMRAERERFRKDRTGTIAREFRIRPPDAAGAEFRWARLSLTTILDEPTRYLYAYLSITDIHERKLTELKAWEEANLDPLTGVFNPPCFLRDLTRRFRGNMAQGGALVVILMSGIDADRESPGGTEAADQLTLQASRTIKAAAREGDLICRLSGDAFALFICDALDEAILHERLRMLCTALYRRTDHHEVSSSIGCACFADHAKPDVLLSEALSAMRWACRHGGNRYEFYIPEMAEPSSIAVAQSPTPPVEGKRVFIRTFGYFGVFVDGQAVLFSRTKAKELLALLVDRRGGFVTASDAIAHLWEDEPANAVTLARYRKTAMRLKLILEEHGIADIVETIRGNRRAVVDAFDCDYYRYLASDPIAVKSYTGAYMVDYSWAESTTALLDTTRPLRPGVPARRR